MLLSPGIEVKEFDLSVVASNSGTNNAAFGGNFTKGYAGKAINVNTVAELIENFGKPTNANFNQWFQCYYYLQYSNGLYISRAVDENGHWNPTENTVKNVINTGKVELNGNPTNLYVGDIVKFGQDGEKEFKIKEIETPQEGKKQIAEITIVNGAISTEYKVTINDQDFSFTSTDDNTTNIANGLSQAIDLPNIVTDEAQNNKITLTAAAVGTPFKVVLGSDVNMSYDVIQEPQRVEGYELVFDDETDFSQIAQASSKVFVKGFSINAFKFIPRDHADTSTLKPTTANEQIPYNSLFMNEDDYDIKDGSIPFPDNYKLRITARTFGEHGNDLKVAIAREKDFDAGNSQSFPGISLNNQFEYKPLENNKEIALLVMSEGIIVEKYIVSCDRNAKDYQGKSLFIDDVIRRKSSYIYVKSNTSIEELPKSQINENVVKLSNGHDGKIEKSEIENAYGSVSDGSIFGDIESLPIDYVISNEESRTIAGKLASDRKDCIAYHGSKFEIVGQNSTKSVQLILDDVNTGEMNSGDCRNSYNCYFGNYAMIWDAFNDKHRWINIAGMVAGARARTSFQLFPWYASAGESQGQLSGILKLAFLPNTGARDKMYVSQVNPVTSFPGKGVMVYGQKTLQAQNSAFSRINVRLLFNHIKRNLSEMLRAYVFQLNDEFTRNNIKAQIDAFLQRIQTLRGVYEFITICDESNNTGQVIDNNELVIDVGLKPTRVAEFIYLNLSAVGSDISLTEVFGG